MTGCQAQATTPLPREWTKHGEIFTDEKSRSIFVCSACLKSIEHFKLAFFAFDMDAFWTHIQTCHMETPTDSNLPFGSFRRRNINKRPIEIIDIDADDDVEVGKRRKYSESLAFKQEIFVDDEPHRSPNPHQSLKQQQPLQQQDLLHLLQPLTPPQSPPQSELNFDLVEQTPSKDFDDVIMDFKAEPESLATMTIPFGSRQNKSSINTPTIANEPLIDECKVEPNQITLNEDAYSDITNMDDYDDDQFTVSNDIPYHVCDDIIELSDDEDDEDDFGLVLPLPSKDNNESPISGYTCECTVCNKVCLFRDEFLSHLESHKQDPEPNISGRLDSCSGDSTTSCSDNGEPCANSATSESERPFKCNFCDITFCKVWQLDRHQRAHIRVLIKKKGKRPFQCTSCGKRTATEKSMLNHRERFHSAQADEQTMNCTICLRLVPKSNLQYHLMTHTSSRNYQCQYCERSYKQKQYLNAHLKKVHPSADTLGQERTISEQSEAQTSPANVTEQEPAQFPENTTAVHMSERIADNVGERLFERLPERMSERIQEQRIQEQRIQEQRIQEQRIQEQRIQEQQQQQIQQIQPEQRIQEQQQQQQIQQQQQQQQLQQQQQQQQQQQLQQQQQQQQQVQQVQQQQQHMQPEQHLVEQPQYTPPEDPVMVNFYQNMPNSPSCRSNIEPIPLHNMGTMYPFSELTSYMGNSYNNNDFRLLH